MISVVRKRDRFVYMGFFFHISKAIFLWRDRYQMPLKAHQHVIVARVADARPPHRARLTCVPLPKAVKGCEERARRLLQARGLRCVNPCLARRHKASCDSHRSVRSRSIGAESRECGCRR